MHPFRQFIHHYTTLREEDWNTIQKSLQPVKFEKGELLLKEGQICKDLYFLEHGLLRFFALHHGEEITKFFTDAPYTFTSQKSFTEKKPATESIQAIEPSAVWKLSVEKAYELLHIPAWSEFVRCLIQEVQFYTENLLLEMQTETAENRYRKMLEEQPEFVQRIPIKYLASYFGIAPQSLSRIRKQMLRK